MYCEFGRSFNEHIERLETERGSDVERQMSEVGKQLRSENRWELLQEKRTDMKLYFLERGIPVDLSIIRFVKILRFQLQQKLSWKIRSFLPEIYTKKVWMHHIEFGITGKMKFHSLKQCIVWSGSEYL